MSKTQQSSEQKGGGIKSSSDQEQLTDHVYDGIQEYDNPLPGWWKFLFWVTIILSPFYVIYFHGAEGRSIHDEYNNHMAQTYELRFAEIGILEPNRETILHYLNGDPKWLSVGKVIFDTHCISCHGADGGGTTGPNLTDRYWKNVKNLEDIAKVIENGAAKGAMPAWKTRLTHPNQIVLTAAYVASLSENPVEGKKQEGKLIEGWEE